MTDFRKIEDKLKHEAKRLLETGEVSVVLAYGKGFDENHPMPYAAKIVADVKTLSLMNTAITTWPDILSGIRRELKLP